MTRQQTNIARHYERLFDAAAVEVTYLRGGQSAALDAVPATTAVQVEDAEGLRLRSRRRDWIVQASALILGGQVETPQIGDRILAASAGRTAIYEVQRLAGEDCWYPCDDLGSYLRIHTRLIGTEAAS